MAAPDPCENVRWKSRDLLFTAKDEAILSAALREAFPAVTFVEEVTQAPSQLEWIPDVVGRTILQILVPDDKLWTPEFRHVSQGWYEICNMPARHLRFHRSTWIWNDGWPDTKWAWDPPTLEAGSITGSYRVGDPREREITRFLREVWSILARISTNRLKGGDPRGNELMGGDRLMMAEATPGLYWTGHHALEWCRNGANLGQRRMLMGCRRPCDDWDPPIDPWYRGLVARVEARYGKDLGDPTIGD